MSTMTDAPSTLTSVVERTQAVKAGAAVVAAHFLDRTAVLVLGEESLLLVPGEGEPHAVGVHAGGILCSAVDKTRIITGGDDGKVMATVADGSTTALASDGKHRWIDHVQVRGQSVAWSAGKHAYVRSADGGERMLELPSTVGAMTFAPKGLRVGIAHYNGVTLWFPNAETAPEVLGWKGSHLGVTFSPDGRFVVSSMQEPMLHGWRLADGKSMRMAGYGGRVRSLAWTASGKWLATSGSTQLILWPFAGKEGPMGKEPRMLAPAESQVDVLACHPRQEVVAVGYANGLVLLVRVEDGAEVLARKPGNAPVTALAWDASGATLAFGTEDGEAGIVRLG
jgi:WD40 repeat protein